MLESSTTTLSTQQNKIQRSPHYSESNLIWIDLEMSGLNPDTDVIIEIATLITDDQLNIIAEGPVSAIHQAEHYLQDMDEWNTKQHGQSGLTQRVRDSQISNNEVEQQTLDFLNAYVPKAASPMCGNSICQDRRFLWRYMPNLEEFFHYRHVDVSTLKELSKRWGKGKIAKFEKQSEHLALQDIYDSINELKYYRQHLLTI